MWSKYLVLSCRAFFLGGCALLLTQASIAAFAADAASKSATSDATTVVAAPAKPEADSLTGWEKMGSSDGIDYFKKEIAGDPVVAMRGEGVVDAPIARVASVVFDDDRAHEWVDSLAGSKLLKMYGDREFLEYTHIGTPFVLKDRDFLTRGTIESDLKEKIITMRIYSVEDPLMPPGKYVRGELQGYWKLRATDSGAKTYVIAEMHADPKGSVPKWIVNLFQKGWAKDTIESLRKQVAKSDIKIMPEVIRFYPQTDAELKAANQPSH